MNSFKLKLCKVMKIKKKSIINHFSFFSYNSIEVVFLILCLILYSSFICKYIIILIYIYIFFKNFNEINVVFFF